MALFYQEGFDINSNKMDPDESKHLAKVLRIRNGAQIEVTDGKGHLFLCEVISVHQKNTEVQVIDQNYSQKSSTYKHVVIAPTKNLDRMEWFVEKAVELGVDELSFILCQNSERRVLKTERLLKKAISAMKQSGNLHLPKINELQKFSEFIRKQEAAAKCIAFVDFENQIALKDQLLKEQHNLVLIGPEGDFTKEEVEQAETNGFCKVSLGNSRLRTETAKSFIYLILGFVLKLIAQD